MVPGAPAPAKLAGEGLPPLTRSVKSDAFAVPPLSFTTFLITTSFPGSSSFVTVQVFCPFAIVPAQSALRLAA